VENTAAINGENEMISEHLIEELRQLNRVEKLRVIQMLVNEITNEEEILTATEYEVWSPYDAPGAAAILMDMLEENQRQNE
jgi:hypothetical protein